MENRMAEISGKYAALEHKLKVLIVEYPKLKKRFQQTAKLRKSAWFFAEERLDHLVKLLRYSIDDFPKQVDEIYELLDIVSIKKR